MQKRGFVQFIIIIVLLIVVVSLLGVSLETLFGNSVLQNNFGFVGAWVSTLWNSYIKVPFAYVWDSVIKPLICIGPIFQCATTN